MFLRIGERGGWGGISTRTAEQKIVLKCEHVDSSRGVTRLHKGIL